MPHNYFFSSLQKPNNKVDIPTKPRDKSKVYRERRASPLLVHVHPVGNEYIGVLLMMRSTFLPQGEKVLIGRSEVPVAVDWQVIETFMQRPAFTQGAKA
jgi:CRISPR-associated protein Cmr1